MLQFQINVNHKFTTPISNKEYLSHIIQVQCFDFNKQKFMEPWIKYNNNYIGVLKILQLSKKYKKHDYFSY